jgi:hypothetical protein
MTKMYPHCGKCSQCIDRRFAMLAASQEGEDPAEAYSVDLLLGKRGAGPDREMALSFVRSAALMTNHLDANDMLDKVLNVMANAEANPLNDKKDQSIVISLLTVVRQVYAHHVRQGS